MPEIFQIGTGMGMNRSRKWIIYAVLAGIILFRLRRELVRPDEAAPCAGPAPEEGP